MEEKKIPVESLKGGLKTGIETKEEFLARHGGSCQKIYQKYTNPANGRTFKIINCLTHGRMFVQ